MKIWIDADGCPVVNQTIRLAKKYKIPVTVVKNYAIHIESDYAEIVTVDNSRDSADYYIANYLLPNDLVITQDNGLAAMVLAKQGNVINVSGRVINSQNIDFILDSRHHGREARMKNLKGPRHKKRTTQDDRDFEMSLEKLISNAN